MTEKFNFCPFASHGLSIEGNAKRRLCCHDLSAETEELDINFSHLSNKVSAQLKQNNYSTHCKFCIDLEKKKLSSPRQEYISLYNNQQKNDKNLIKFLDITLDNICNLRCNTCKPLYSKSLTSEFEKLGLKYTKAKTLKTSQLLEIISKLSNDAFIVLTGGEPFVSQQTFRFLRDLIEKKDTSQMTLRLFTNLTIIPDWFESIIPYFKEIKLVGSLDGHGAINDYIRFPSKWDNITHNLDLMSALVKKYSNLELDIHSVLQVHNLNFVSDFIVSLKPYKNIFCFVPSFTIIETPHLFNPKILPQKILQPIQKKQIENLEKILNSIEQNDFSELAIRRLKKIIKQITTIESNNSTSTFIQFTSFSKKKDQFRNIDIDNYYDYFFKVDI